MEVRLSLRSDHYSYLVALKVKHRRALRWAWRLAGPLLLIFFLTRIDLAWLLERLRHLTVAAVSTAIALTLPIVVLRCWRWRLFLPHPRPAIGATLRVYAVAALLGALSPAQLGEFGKVFAPLPRAAGNAASFFWATLLDRLLDVVVVLLAAAMFLAVFQPFTNARAVILVGLGIGLVVLALCFKPEFRFWLKNRLKLLPQRFPASWRGAFPHVHFTHYLVGLALSLLAWLLNWSAIWVTATAMGLAIPFFYLAGVMAGAALLSLLPVTVLGIGTRDAALIFLLAPLGIDTPSALALSSVVLFLRVLYATICALASWTPGRPGPKGKEDHDHRPSAFE